MLECVDIGQRDKLFFSECQLSFRVSVWCRYTLEVLEIFLTENALVEDLLCGAPSCSEARLFFSEDLLRLWLQSVQYGLQHDFAWETNEAYCSVVLALLQVAFLVKCEV